MGGVAYTWDLNNTPDAFVAAEFLPDGELNTSFATGGQIGQIITSGNTETYDGTLVASVLPQSDGDIVFAGSTLDDNNGYYGNEADFLLLAVTSSGELDNSFAANGELITPFFPPSMETDGPTDLMYAAAETPDGKIDAVGVASPGEPGPGVVFARFIVQPTPSVAVADASATAGQDLEFVVDLSSLPTLPVTASYTFTLGTASSSDFDSTAGTVTIAAGSTTATIEVPTYGDSTGSDEQFTITLASLSSNAVFANGESTESATGTIAPIAVSQITSETSLQASANEIVQGNSIELTAHVSGAGTVPTGNVTFSNNGAALGSSALDNSADASLQTNQLPTGSNSITATYSGDSNYLGSTSLLTTVTVTDIQTSITTLAAAATTLVVGQSDTLTVSVTPSTADGSIPTGDVTIFQDGIARGTYPLQTNGMLTETYSVTAPLSSTQFTASYVGDANFAASTSAAVTQACLPASSVNATVLKAVIPASGIAGQSFKASLPIRIENSGTLLKGKFTTSFYLDGVSSDLDGKQIELRSETDNLTLKPGKSAIVKLALKTLPASVRAGTYHIVTEIADPATQFDLVTTAQTIHVGAPVIALSASTSSITPDTLKPGKAGFLEISITNTGNVPAHGPMNITVTGAYLNESGTEITLSNLNQMTTIAPRSTKRYRLKIVVPKAASSGTVNPITSIKLADAVATIDDMAALIIG